MKQLMALALAGALLAAGCGGDDGENRDADSTIDTAAVSVPSPQELTEAYGGMVGECMAADMLGMDYKIRASIREKLQVLTNAAQADPDAQAGEGLTVRELLFDSVAQLEDCDRGTAVEAQAAVDRLP